ncbi:SRPBCC family protein [Actinomycetospora sp. CA-053990]|uniref:SRPBCC family protein n=1 Tax=Actinomycetospora sp. CA-053990 TaxID=3239891 RepID=UPI003D947CE4
MTDQDPRTVDLEVTVPGTPEQVWDAIATGPGISSWLHPTRVDEHVGGAFGFDMGGSAEAAEQEPQGTVTAYDAPHRFATEAPWSTGGQSTTLATEWLVAARDEGTCVVRMVMSGFGPGDDWDDEIDALREGMGVALETLRLYLAHFAGRRPAVVESGTRVAGPPRAAFDALLRTVGLDGAMVGDRVVLTGTPSLAGTVEVLSPGEHRCDVVLLVDSPGPGVADLATYGADTGVGVHLTVFDAPGTDAARVAEREQPLWTAWTEALR